LNKNIVIYTLFSFSLSLLFTYFQYKIFYKKGIGQFIRQEGPDLHQHKMGTPSAGGVSLVFALIFTIIFFRLFKSEIIYLALFMLLFSSIGFFDDFIKFKKNRSLGFKARYKLLLQVIFSLILIYLFREITLTSDTLIIPFSKKVLHLGIWYVPFLVIFIISTLNAFNLTDGLDGLLSGLFIISMIFFLIYGFLNGNTYANIFNFIVIGAVLGFLWHNFYPASIFLGDTGAFALGGVISGLSIMYHLELYLFIVGIVFVVETLSVIIQVGSIKFLNKKPFLMSPIHHHFEMMGWKEPKIILRFWIIGMVFLILSLGDLFNV